MVGLLHTLNNHYFNYLTLHFSWYGIRWQIELPSMGGTGPPLAVPSQVVMDPETGS